MSVEFVNPDSLPKPVGYAHVAIGRGRPVVLAGQIGWNREGKVEAPGDLVKQFALALDNLLEALRAAGGEATDLAQMRIFTTDVPAYRRHLRELGAEYRKRFGKHFPAMVLAGVTELFEPGTVVEIEGIAYVDD
ncbi:MAG: RidA family protein [Planctomycetota bacterium]